MIWGDLGRAARIAIAGGALACLCVPAAQAADKPTIVKLDRDRDESRFRPRLDIGTLGSFTPSSSQLPDRVGVVEERRFSFTPAGAKGDKRKAVTVGVTSRVARAAPSSETKVPAAIAAQKIPAEVGVDVAVGYAGFSLSGGYTRTQSGVLVPRQGAEVGVSYSADSWKAALQAKASVPEDHAPIGLLPQAENYSFEFGGAYALSPGLALKGGVRYDLVRPEAFGRDFVNRDAERAEESGTIYLGTSLSF